MDNKELGKEALLKYPKAWRAPTKAEQVAYFDPNEQKRAAYIAGAISSTRVKELEEKLSSAEKEIEDRIEKLCKMAFREALQIDKPANIDYWWSEFKLQNNL